MALNSSSRSPREEGELEDGEISDDDNDENQLVCPDKRPSSSNSNAGRSSRSCKPQPRPLSPHISGPGHDYRMNMQFNRGPHPPKSIGHRQKGGPNGPGRAGSGPLCESGPRSSFWERSNSAFDRLGHRGRWSAGRGDRGERGIGRPPPGRVGFAGSVNRKESPPRKPKSFGRPALRKPNYSTAKNVNGIEDSFEDLLKKYKQIQHELECIRKEERTAFTSKEESPRKEPAVSVSARQSIPVPSSIEEVEGENAEEAVAQDAQKPFQAFNLKPLRQKLLTPAERDQINKVPGKEEPALEEIELSLAEPSSTAKESVETDLSISYASSKESDDLPEKEVVKDDDDEVSEMQLRLLALQSASKKWQQKEQQVLKESKEKLSKTRPAQQKGKAAVKPHCGKKSSSAGSAAKQAWRKQQVRTWKLQQQKEQEKRQREDEEKRRAEEEEERRKREEEIRKIRDLSNQDEQYNRFMKLVGGKRSSRSKTSDSEHRKSLNKQGTDASGNLYQYDNYDEVAMETDSETSSPVSSPMHNPFVPELPPYFQMAPFPMALPPHTVTMQSLNEQYLDSLDPMEPPPPLPPLPPDEPEQPPKPPFADEEEEEEMLLREELLKSLASKRPVKSEDTSSNSSPPSPPMTITVQCFPSSNLSTVSINTASHSRSPSTRFVRGPPAPRPLLVLPRHKAVVVQLNNSDDSESDSESSGSSRFVFGGLESMIKEARRTAEASKPKTPSRSEKENNQVKTPEALPVDKKIEYRLLKEEIASREQQRILKSSQSRGSPSPASSDVELDFVGRSLANLQVSEAENKLMKHKNLLMKDEMLLKHLVQQELKKKESLKASESKSAGLKEQLLATEKIVNANKTLLKKLQEQIHRVQHRVSTKRNQALKFEKDLAQAKANAGHGQSKRKSEANYLSPSKLLRLDPNSPRSPGKQFTELIAQEKKRLQQLESEYALKIQKLKEAQALRSKELSAESVVSIEEELPEFSIPQPSLHDLTQDKLTLDSEENEVEDEVLSPSVRERRRSFRESSAFTKPNLKHTESLSKPAKKTAGEPELFLGLNVDDLQKLYKEGDRLKELLEKSTAPMLALTGPPARGQNINSRTRKGLARFSAGVVRLAIRRVKTKTSNQEVPVDLDTVMTQTVRGDLKPASFGPYHSPLLVFKSYRFSPYFRTKEKLYLSSVSYSNIIEPKKCFCRFDLTGTCNDDDCQWQHMRDCTLSRSQLFQDILSYNLPVVGCSETSTGEEISVATEKYLDKLFGMNKDRMATDPMAVLLVSKINESKSHTPPYTTCKELRKWRPQQRRKPDPNSSSSDDEESKGSVRYDRSWKASCALDVCVTPDDVRYFTSETDDISNLEASVVESPRDVQLWIKLAYNTPSECLDSVLNTLARALEDNRENPEVWCHYLNLFAKRGTKDEVQEMCETAVEYAPDYKVWWNFLNLETSFDGKDYVCGRMLQFLLGTAEGDNKSELLSFQLLESLLYRVQLSLFTGRHQNALAILQNALKSTDGERSLAEHLILSDRCLAWLAYIHLIEFNSLPGRLYDPAHANPARIVNKEPFLIPWQSLQDVKTDPDMLFALFEDAVHACSDESLSPGERTAACLPIYRNMIVLNQVLDRWEAAVKLCETLLVPCPDCCMVLESLAQLYIKRQEADKAIDVWLGAFRKNPHNAQIFYSTCKFLVLQYKFTAPCVKQELSDQLSIQIPYMWLIDCLWQTIHASVGDAVDAFERALGTVMQQDVMQKLWLDYLLFTSSKLIGSKTKNRDFKMFTDLVHRCLVTVPTRFIIPLSSADYWTNFEFHNKVVSFYLSCLPKSQHSKALERFRSVMPANTDLALRLLWQEWHDGNIQHLKHQARTLTSSSPMCLTIWKIAIAVEKELKGLAEQLLFEASEGGKTDNLRKLVAKCQEVGVSLDELLNLSSNRPEGKDH
ncbi:Zinc finger C3H1 domain-containing protein [Acipenser ruthenus]|uniref:Zinc finger C3H1 domain-containing protein n=1 Tax=Acipenser ruthenus TaxID=7906 RepID=A0A444V3G9_ACIRT|nr:Zinc finger C3H1 domain-containing protein [Acipenser ruthenus]